jgi:hypothetical protein
MKFESVRGSILKKGSRIGYLQPLSVPLHQTGLGVLSTFHCHIVSYALGYGGFLYRPVDSS